MISGHISRRAGWAVIGALMLALLAALGRVAYGGPLDPPAPPAPTQQGWIFQPSGACPAGFPITISAPGSYKLAGNITGCSGKDGIDINASDVTLDLNGFTLTGVAGAVTGVNVAVGNGVTVANGQVVGWPGFGVNIAADDSTARDLVIRGSGRDGLDMHAQGHATRVTSDGNAGIGIAVFADSVITDCITGHNTFQGISVGAGHTTISGCESSVNSIGIQVWGADNLIEGNNVHDNLGAGIAASGASAGQDTIAGNNVANNGGIGIASGQRSHVRNNNVTANGSHGIVVGVPPGSAGVLGSIVSGNNVAANTGNGIDTEGPGVDVMNNNVTSNTGDGIYQHWGEASVIGNNASHNGARGIDVPNGGVRVDANHADHNGAQGYFLSGSGAPGTCIAVRNSAAANTGVNYQILGGCDAGPVGTAATSTSPWANISD